MSYTLFVPSEPRLRNYVQLRFLCKYQSLVNINYKCLIEWQTQKNGLFVMIKEKQENVYYQSQRAIIKTSTMILENYAVWLSFFNSFFISCKMLTNPYMLVDFVQFYHSYNSCMACCWP